MKNIVNILIRAFLTGIAIGIGGAVFLSCESKVVGAFLFGTGLFTILTFGFYLYTGKVGYIVENKPKYIGEVALIWLGNLIGTFVFARLLLLTRVAGISAKAAAMCEVKMNDSLVSLFVLAIFCGMLMFIAADGYKKISHETGKCLAIFLPVMAFILSGFEHCVANMFYFSLADAWTVKSFGYLLVMTLGNAVGGMLIPLCRKAMVENQ
ncbi:formate/nitrite transporter family protein [Treponema sp.]|uniref:formate/nitrite transporter family protein n=1 Tax=Treponema sp. TaxID=166 RepID=UPI00298EB48E|nr:formate/nitrite transporter family protein [Treponema sp.]MCQ2241047.1 formate/nitrite transporter family protein [Treponema sp.]